MELQRGVCSLCSEHINKVLLAKDAEDIINNIPTLLNESILTEENFQKMKASIKICTMCCYKIEEAVDIKKSIDEASAETTDLSEINCHFCKTDKTLIKINNDWKYIAERTNGFLTNSELPTCLCPRCLFYLDVVYNLRIHLTNKFPKLVTKLLKPLLRQNNETPKRKSESKSPPTTKKRKLLDNCFSYLQPLCNNNYWVDHKMRTDDRLYRKIAYVNLTKATIKSESTKSRPVIKIKLKTKRGIKSEELVKKVSHKTHRRYSSHVGELNKNHKNDVNDDSYIDETPKAAHSSNIVPKRRVSLFIEQQQKEAEIEENQEKENVSNVDTGEVSQIVDKYIQDTNFNDKNNLNLLEVLDSANNGEKVEINGNDKEDEAKQKTEIISENKNDENTENKEQSIIEVIEEEKKEDTSQIESKEAESTENIELETESEDIVLVESNEEKSDEAPTENKEENKIEPCPLDNLPFTDECNDLDSSQLDKSKDSLNGSDRKKKRVTFSDDLTDSI